jgi:P-type conjugative transfer protein TrbJ
MRAFMRNLCQAARGRRRPPRIAICLATGLAVIATAPHRASGLIVFDPSNYSQNLLTAARSLQAIENQIKSLENEAQMLVNQARNLRALPDSLSRPLVADLAEIRGLLHQAEGVSFEAARTRREFADLYPRLSSLPRREQDMTRQAEARWTASFEALRTSLLTQSEIAAAIDRDASNLETALGQSSGATGSLQAQQAGNQLLGLSIKQAMQTAALMAAQARAESLKAAEEKEAARAARQRFARFIGAAPNELAVQQAGRRTGQ